jgi:hypothetical protein
MFRRKLAYSHLYQVDLVKLNSIYLHTDKAPDSNLGAFWVDSVVLFSP